MVSFSNAFGSILAIGDDVSNGDVLIGWDDAMYKAMSYSVEEANGSKGFTLWDGGGRRRRPPGGS